MYGLCALTSAWFRNNSIKRKSAEARLRRAVSSVEGLEARMLLAVTASVSAGTLTVALGAANDTATLTATSTAGSDIQVAGTGLGAEQFSGVSAIHVLDAGSNAGQSATFTSSGTNQIELAGGISITGIESVVLSTSTAIHAASFVEAGASSGVQVDTAGVATNGTMSFGDTVTLGADTTLDTTDAGGTPAGAALTLAGVIGAGHGLTLTGGTAGAVTFNGAVSNVAGLTATAGSIDVEGAITATTSGAMSLTATSSILVDAAISTANGTLTLSANQQATATSGNFVGIEINGATIHSTGTGVVNVSGRGGDDASGQQVGVLVNGSGAEIGSAGASVTVSGQGGGSGTGGSNDGVDILSGGTITAGGSGTVTVSGTGGANDTAGSDIGVILDGIGALVTSGGGNVSVAGQGGGAGTGGFNYGVGVADGDTITAGGSGSLTVTGTGGATSGGNDAGVVVAGVNTAATITSTGGNVSVTGQGGGSGASGTNVGVAVEDLGKITAGGTGTVAVSGTGGATSGSQDHGVWLVVGGAQVTSAGGDVSVTGAAGGGTNSFDVDIDTSATVSSGGNGDLLIQANSLNVAGTASIQGGAGGNRVVTIDPRTPGTNVNLGGADATGTLGLTNAELGGITAGILRIGDLIASGNITITAPISDLGTGWNTLSLLTELGAGISENSGATLTVTNLQAAGNTGVTLDQNNVVSTLAGASDVGAFSFVDSTNLTVDNVDSGLGSGFGSGIITAAQRVNLTVNVTNGSLTVNQRIDTTHSFGGPASAGANIGLSADQMAPNNNSPSSTINAGTGGILALTPLTPGNTIAVGGADAAGTLGIDDNDLSDIIAKAVRIGSTAQTGKITIDGTINTQAGFHSLDLIATGSGGAITQTTGSITVGNLALQASAGIGSVGAIEVFGPINLAFRNNISGNVQINSTGALTIASVDQLDGTSGNQIGNFAPGGTTTISAASPLTFAINATSGGTITATTTETATETVTPLPPPDDNITINSGVTVQSTGGDVSLQSADGIVINASGQVLAPAGSIIFSCGDGDNDDDGSMSLNGTLSAMGNITLNIPAGDSATLTGTAMASQAIENGGGSLFVDGPTGLVTSGVAVNANTLGGTGTITGPVSVAPGGTLAAGDNAPGILSTGSDTLSSGSTFSVQLAGPTPGNTAGSYSQLDANGNVNLNNATLAAALTFTPGSTQTFTLIQATGSISGQFAQGSTIVLNGSTYSILYQPHSVVLSSSADVSVSMAGPASAIEGGGGSYTYTVSNAGPGAAQNVVLSALVPAGAVLVSAGFGGAFSALPASAYDPSTGTVNLGSLASAASGTLTLTIQFPEENPGVTFAASVSSSMLDSNLLNNSTSLTTKVNDAPLTAQGQSVSPSQGSKIFSNVTVATFSDANLAAPGSDFTATVNWGDGTVSTAQIVANSNGTFSVVASHTYSNDKNKSYPLTIQIVDAGGSTVAVTGTAILHPGG